MVASLKANFIGYVAIFKVTPIIQSFCHSGFDLESNLYDSKFTKHIIDLVNVVIYNQNQNETVRNCSSLQ